MASVTATRKSVVKVKSRPPQMDSVLSVNFLFEKCDPTPLAIFRILFGFLMILDVPEERGLAEADLRFSDPNYCFFPLFPGIEPLTLSHACIAYSVMWLGAIGIMLGLKFRLSCFLYLMPYVYFLLLDKSRWNNHSYLFALIVILIAGSGAGQTMSMDNYFLRRPSVSVPKWNYLMLKFQFFILYFYAAIKKLDCDWLSGYSMKNLTNHWIFDPMKIFASGDTIEFYMIHVGGLFYDLTVGFMLNIPCVKQLAFFLSFMFHGLNAQMFTIGMFPYVCMASLVLFCEPHEFPCSIFMSKKLETATTLACSNSRQKESDTDVLDSSSTSSSSSHKNKGEILVIKSKQKNESRWWKILFMSIYVVIQLFLPFTHSITKGYNNWTPGLYGYSWNMMIYSWNTLHVKVTVVDTVTRHERYLDPDAWVISDRWSSHADMAKQYSQCIARNLANFNITNVEVYFDVWKSLNGRFQQRVFDPRVDILKAPWSPWESVPWVLPLLEEYSDWRGEHFDSIAKNVANWTASSNVIFVSDYPGLFLENYMPPELANVSVTLLRGEITVEQEQQKHKEKGKFNITLSDSTKEVQSLQIFTGGFHKIYTVGPTPSCYMYTYTNATTDTREEALKLLTPNNTQGVPETEILNSSYDMISDFVHDQIEIWSRSFYLIFNSYMNVLFDVPMIVRRAI